MTIQFDMVYLRRVKKHWSGPSIAYFDIRVVRISFPLNIFIGTNCFLVKLITLWRTVNTGLAPVIYILSWYNEYFLLNICYGV